MEQPFTIIKTFLGDVEYSFPNPLKSLINHDSNKIEQSADIDLKVRNADEPLFYVIDLHVNIMEGICGQTDYQIKLVYSALVKMNNEVIDEDDTINMLAKEVPKELITFVRGLVQVLTAASGFPEVVLEEIDFDALNLKSRQLLGYDWILNDIRSSVEGAGFLNTLVFYAGDSCLRYKDSPMYKYFYRFMEPINYMHPDYDECEPEFWELFFQLVFGEGVNISLIQENEEYPEIEFSFPGFDTMRVSNLTLKELKSITSALATDAFTKTMVSFCGLDINEDYEDTLASKPIPLESEIHKLYNYDPTNMSSDSIVFINHVCERLNNYDDVTFEYRLLHK